MCGIVGAVSLNGQNRTEELDVRQMLAMIRHRGPDQFGVYLDDVAALGSARLSIIDLSSGQQPIHNEDGNLWIVFNGEIFNYLELRPELEYRGHRFTTNTDTEVLLHLYEDMGPACVEHLNGQFAFAIWNQREQTLFLARDRMGIRPLFYTISDGTLVFASEIKSLFAYPGVRREMDPESLNQIFVFWSTLSPRTAFRGVTEVPPGHYLTLKKDKLVTKRYWQMQFPEEPPVAPRRLEDYLEEFTSLLVDATRIRLRADVPVGAYLSGGLDSSTIAAIIRKHNCNHLDTFSIAFSDPAFDESEFQMSMARFLGTSHQVVRATHADIGRVFPDVIWHTEAPILRTAPAPMFLLSELVRQNNFKVVLTGEGADEILAGYDIFKEAKVRRFWARHPESKMRPLLLRRLYPDIGGLTNTAGAYLTEFFRNGMSETNLPWYSHAVRWRNTSRTRRFFTPELRQELDQVIGAVPYPHAFRRWEPLAQAQYLESSIFLSQYLLSSQGDRVAMAHSVEGRFPFLDFRVIEFCNSLPPAMKLRALTEKFLLKRLGSDLVPEEIWRRPKRPYRAPIHRSFFSSPEPEYLREILSPQALQASGLFEPRAVGQLVCKIEQGRPIGETDDMALAGIISSQLVHSRFVSAFQMPSPLAAGDDVKVVRTRQLV